MNSMLIVLKGILILEISVLVCTGSLLFEYMYVLYTVLLKKILTSGCFISPFYTVVTFSEITAFHRLTLDNIS